MKKYELRIEYRNGEVDDYYSRLTGKYWESDAETAEEALQEMRQYDSETFFELEKYNREYWVEEMEEE